MTSINSINVNAQGIGATGFGAKGAKAEQKEAKKENVQVQENAKQAVSPDKVLDFMAANAVMVTPKTAATNGIEGIDVSKYVDSASAERIAGFIASFEDKVAEGLAAFEKDFAGMNMSDDTKMAVVLKSVEA